MTQENVESALKMACHDFEIRQDIKVVSIEKGHRVVLSYEPVAGNGDFHRQMIQIERRMKHILKTENLDLTLESKVDRNKRETRSGR